MPGTNEIVEATVQRSVMPSLVAKFDWAGTPLGAVEHWSPALNAIVGVVLASNHPMLIWWGPERHPSALGQSGEACWQEIWPIIRSAGRVGERLVRAAANLLNQAPTAAPIP